MTSELLSKILFSPQCAILSKHSNITYTKNTLSFSRFPSEFYKTYRLWIFKKYCNAGLRIENGGINLVANTTQKPINLLRLFFLSKIRIIVSLYAVFRERKKIIRNYLLNTLIHCHCLGIIFTFQNLEQTFRNIIQMHSEKESSKIQIKMWTFSNEVIIGTWLLCKLFILLKEAKVRRTKWKISQKQETNLQKPIKETRIIINVCLQTNQIWSSKYQNMSSKV